MNKAAFSLENYFFDKVELDLTQIEIEDILINFNPSGEFISNDSVYNLSLVFRAKKDKNDLMPFINISCKAVYKFNDQISFDQIPSHFFANSIAIIFPYIRAFVSIVTIQTNTQRPLILPTLNLTELSDELKSNTKIN